MDKDVQKSFGEKIMHDVQKIAAGVERLEVVYIVPSRYDDDGYVQRWTYGVVPSHSLAVVSCLTEEMANRDPFPGVSVRVSRYDDNVQVVPIRQIAAMRRRGDTRVVVGFVGVQTNQFPRAVDLARQFRKHGIPVLIGGFHVTGVVNLFEEIPSDLQAVIDDGITLVCGEAETPGVLESLFADVLQGTLQPIYRFPFAPSLDDAPLPVADPQYVDHFGAKWATIDSSRGCPYGCSFCTVINIQGRKMRCRQTDTVLATVNANHDCGVRSFFFTDDNFARSKHWRDIFDGLIAMRSEGKNVSFMMQVDTQSYRIPDFATKAKEAGCRSVFVGMESVNAQNIASSGKSQNDVEQYREMVTAWQECGVMVHVGYIIGFPHDTKESVVEDVRFLRDNVGVDLASFFMMTPLPGSVDHLEMVRRGDALDADWNKYDSFHETFAHPQMAPGEWKAAALAAYSEFYSKDNIVKILRRTPREHYWLVFWNLIWYRYSGVLSATHPMMTGFFRRKSRSERRAGMPVASRWRFAWRMMKEFVCDAASYTQLFFEFQEVWFLTRRQATEPAARWTWRPLTQWTNGWAAWQQRMAKVQAKVPLGGRCDELLGELREQLMRTAESLRQTSRAVAKSILRKERREAKSLDAVASEIEAYLETTATSRADHSLLQRTQSFIQERLVLRCEEIMSRSVALRRRVTAWRTKTLRALREGRLVTATVSALTHPWLAFVEAYSSLRFGIAAMRKEI